MSSCRTRWSFAGLHKASNALMLPFLTGFLKTRLADKWCHMTNIIGLNSVMADVTHTPTTSKVGNQAPAASRAPQHDNMR